MSTAMTFACGMIYGYEKPFVGGCGKPVIQHESYRCADCTASFHRDCIREHFEMDDAIKNLRAPECWRKDCAESKRELAELREQVRWIPVSEGLPDNFNLVLVSVRPVPEGPDWYPRTNQFLAWHKRSGIWFGTFVDPLTGKVEAGEFPDDLITHWRPLGPAPEKE